MGGYGAIFWLWVAGLLGMIIKYSEVVLSVHYRKRNEKGDWVGGPMYYIENPAYSDLSYDVKGIIMG